MVSTKNLWFIRAKIKPGADSQAWQYTSPLVALLLKEWRGQAAPRGLHWETRRGLGEDTALADPEGLGLKRLWEAGEDYMVDQQSQNKVWEETRRGCWWRRTLATLRHSTTTKHSGSHGAELAWAFDMSHGTVAMLWEPRTSTVSRRSVTLSCPQSCKALMWVTVLGSSTAECSSI